LSASGKRSAFGRVGLRLQRRSMDSGAEVARGAPGRPYAFHISHCRKCNVVFMYLALTWIR
jgi:hypothetical protein